MKKTKNLEKNVTLAVIVIAILSIVATVAFYGYRFSQYDLSYKTQNWAEFGSYFGGVLSPILTFITLIILIRQIKTSQDATDAQIASAKISTDAQIQSVQDSTKAQIKHLQESREIELIVTELNHVSSIAFDMMTEVRQMPKANIKLLFTPNTARWDHDYGNKLVIFIDKDKNKFNAQWEGSILYLKSILEHYNEEDALAIINKHEHVHIYQSISSLIGHMILHCYKLVGLDPTSYSLVRTKLSKFYDAIYYLNKAKFVDDDLVFDFHLLQSIARPLGRKEIFSLNDILCNEINDTDLFIETVNSSEVESIEIEMNNEQKGCIKRFIVQYDGREIVREHGKWRDMLPNEKAFEVNRLKKWQ